MFWCDTIKIDIPAKEVIIGDILYCGIHTCYDEQSQNERYKKHVYLPIKQIDTYPQLQLMVFIFEMDDRHKDIHFDSLEININRMVEVQRSCKHHLFRCC